MPVLFEKLIATIVAQNARGWIQLSSAPLCWWFHWICNLIEKVLRAPEYFSVMRLQSAAVCITTDVKAKLKQRSFRRRVKNSTRFIFLRIFVFIIFLNNVHNHLNLHGFFIIFFIIISLKLDYNFPTSHHHHAGGTLWSSLF